MFTNIEEVYAYLFSKRGKHTSNQQFAYLFAKYQQFHLKIKCIHITGTNGKGSTANYISAILQNHNFKVGLFTSPHLVVHNDRIKINGKMIDDDTFIHYVNQYYEDFENFHLNMFQIDTFLALLYFYEQKVDFAIIEVGIGGLYDSTNLIYPILSVITSIGLDHQELLGDSLTEIAHQKCGIIKPYIPLICNIKDNKIRNLVIKTCNERKSNCTFITKAENISFSLEKLTFTYKGMDIRLNNVGLYQAENVALAIESTMMLQQLGYVKINSSILQNTLKDTKFAGRFEIIRKNPYIILDGAHNLHGIETLIKTIKKLSRPVKILYSACLDKNPNIILSKLLDVSSPITVCEFSYYRSLHITDIEENIKQQIKWIAHVDEALSYCLKQLQEDEILLITGSLYFISEVRKKLL